MALRLLLAVAACSALLMPVNGQAISLEDGVADSAVDREAMGRMLMDMGTSTTVDTSHPCFSDSTNATACNGFALTEAEIAADISAQCTVNRTGAMPWMIGCTLRQLCQVGQASGPYCGSFSILADLCVDMPGMGGCKRYNLLCSNPRSVVQQCALYQAIPRVLTSTQTQKDIIAMCTDHTMDGCEQCPAIGARCPDPASLISQLCLGMPDMALCGRFWSFCAVAGSQFPTLCITEASGGLPPMKMYFHTTLKDIILFKEWVPGNRARYFGSCLAIILMGIVLTALRCGRVLMEMQWKGTSMSRCMCREQARIEIGAQMLQAQALAAKAAAQTSNEHGHDGSNGVDMGHGVAGASSAGIAVGCPVHKGAAAPPTISQLKQNALRAIMTGLVYILELALMLIAMTFNVGYFFCVVGGSMLGTLLFGHMSEQARMVVRRDSGGGTATSATAIPAGAAKDGKGMAPWPVMGCDIEQPPAVINNSCCCSEA